MQYIEKAFDPSKLLENIIALSAYKCWASQPTFWQKHHGPTIVISWSPIVLQGARYSSRDYTYYTMTLTGKKLTEDVYQPFPGSTALMM